MAKILDATLQYIVPDKQYYWRVDCVIVDEDGKEITSRGDIWNFSTI